MIPDKNEPQWAELVQSKLEPELSSFSLKMKINSVRQHYKSGALGLNDAIDDLYSLCVKYEKIYADDLNNIF